MIRVDILDQTGRLRKFDEIEADVLRAALRHCDGRMARAAKALGVGRSTAYRKMDRLSREIVRVEAQNHHHADDRVVGRR